MTDFENAPARGSRAGASRGWCARPNFGAAFIVVVTVDGTAIVRTVDVLVSVGAVTYTTRQLAIWKLLDQL